MRTEDVSTDREVGEHPGRTPGAQPGGNTEPEGDSAGRIAELLSMLFRLAKRTMAAQHTPIEPAAYPVLWRLAAEGPRRAGELAAVTCADPSTVSRQVAALVRAGLVERRADPQDGRASQLAPTAEGLRVLAAERDRRAEYLTRVLGGWPAEDRAVLGDLLERFVSDLQDAVSSGDLRPATRHAPRHTEPVPSGAAARSQTSHETRSTTR